MHNALSSIQRAADLVACELNLTPFVIASLIFFKDSGKLFM